MPRHPPDSQEHITDQERTLWRMRGTSGYPYSAYSSRGREEKDRFQGQEPQVPSVLILQGISQLLPPHHPHGECGQAHCMGKAQGRGELRRMRLSLKR